MKKGVKIGILVAILIAVVVLCSACGNRSVGIDTFQTFNKAWIKLGDEWKLMPVQSWRDYEGDVVQFVSGGVPYVTSYVNVVLIGK